MAEHGAAKHTYRKSKGVRSRGGLPHIDNRLWVIAHMGTHPTECAYCGGYVKEHLNLDQMPLADIPAGWKFPTARGTTATRLYNSWKQSTCFQIPGLREQS